MMILTVVSIVIVLALLLIVAGVMPRQLAMNAFELERRVAMGDAVALAEQRRMNLSGDVISLQRALIALLLVVIVSLVVVACGWLLGIVVAMVIALEYGAVARIAVIRRPSQKLYDSYEVAILGFVERLSGFMRLIRATETSHEPERRLESREELRHLVAQATAILTSNERLLIDHSLTFADKRVREVMTPKSVIDSIGKNELLGPLVLHDLHKTGHSRFPVIDGDIDHIVGMLHVQDLMSLDTKRSTTAEKAMERRVFYIRDDQTLSHALAAFLRTHHHLFIVVNEYRETVGLLSLEDTIEALIGHKIVDEFDLHDDLRAVAMRSSQLNNQAENHSDV
jgi:CBS domain containing-hemolysin-like protein